MNYNLWVGMSIACIATGVAATCALALLVSRWVGGLVKPTVTALYVGMFLTMAAFLGQPQTIANAELKDLFMVAMVGLIVALASAHIEGMKAYENGLDPELPYAKRPMKVLLGANAGLVLAVLAFHTAI